MKRRTAIVGGILFLVGAQAEAALPPPLAPAENPMTEAKRVLGKILFWDEQLSSDRTVSCGSCHVTGSAGGDPRIGIHPGFDEAFGTVDDVFGSPGVHRADDTGTAVADPLFGLGTQVTPRAANITVGALYAPQLFWDGRADGTFTNPEDGTVSIAVGGALESQAVNPIVSDVEMAREGRTWADVDQRIASVVPLGYASDLPTDVAAALSVNATYPDLFTAAFGSPEINAERVAFAIATYERTMVADQTPWDAFIAGDPTALTPQQQDGWNQFQALNCILCHTPPLFTNQSFHNIGIRPPDEDLGRQDVTGLDADRGRFKVPTLRNSGLKRTFMHNGRIGILQDAVAWYRVDNPQRSTDNLDPALPLPVGPVDVQLISDFVRNGLTDPRVAAEQFPFDRPTLHAGAMTELEIAANHTSLQWPLLQGAQSYTVYRGSLSSLADHDEDGLPDTLYGGCVSDLEADTTDGRFDDPDVPALGEGFFYVKGMIEAGGAERGLGATSAGLPRTVLQPCP